MLYITSYSFFVICLFFNLKKNDRVHFGGGIDVLKEFASKKCGKLGKLLKERGDHIHHGVQMKHRDSSRAPNPSPSSKSDFTQVNKFHFSAIITSSLLQITELNYNVCVFSCWISALIVTASRYCPIFSLCLFHNFLALSKFEISN